VTALVGGVPEKQTNMRPEMLEMHTWFNQTKAIKALALRRTLDALSKLFPHIPRYKLALLLLQYKPEELGGA
jgi:hypothetical protein